MADLNDSSVPDKLVPDLNDKLVLYLEENYEGMKDMSCYVLYSFVDEEYFICGSRIDEEGIKYGQFKFFCKTATMLLDYLAFIVNAEGSKLSYGLFNQVSVFDENYVDYEVLETRRNEYNEIALYINMEFNKRQLHKLMHMLKYIRY